MRRSGEGQARIEDPSISVDAFSSALKDEKDPVVRGYVENLRRQVADIAGKYRVNARDVFKADVQARMDVDDLAAVAKLVKRIGLFLDGARAKPESKEFSYELDRLERPALAALHEAIKFLQPFPTDVVEMLAQDYLRAGLPEEAWIFQDSYGTRVDKVIRAKILLARGRVDEAIVCIRDYAGDHDKQARAMLDALDMRLKTLSDEELRQEPGNYAVGFGWMVPVIYHRIRKEYERRGIDDLTDPAMRSLEPVLAHRGAALMEMKSSPKIRLLLATAECDARLGRDPSIPLGYARNVAVAMMRDDRVNMMPEIVEMAAKLGQFDVVEAIAAVDWETRMDMGEDQPDLWLSAAIGCVEARNFDKAIALLRDSTVKHMSDWTYAAQRLMEGLLRAGEIERAKALLPEFDEPASWEVNRALLIARARRGERAIDDARAGVARLLANGYSQQLCDILLARTAIATIGFVEAMKRRMGAYEKR